MSHVLELSPYEEFVRTSLDEKKKELESLKIELEKAGPLRKRMLSSRIADITQNIEILTSNLAKYGHGLSWLREPTKERDEKAEHLGPVDVSVILGQSKPAAAAPGGAAKPAPPIGARPGVPGPGGAKAPTPTVVASAPRPGVTVGTPKPASTPVGRPVVGQPKPAIPVPSTAVPSSGPHPAPPPSEEKKEVPPAPKKKDEEKEGESSSSS